MAPSTSRSAARYGINILGQQPILQSYGQILAGFALPPDQTHEAVIEQLQSAARMLYGYFPRLAGQVVNTGASSTSTGTFSIIPYPPSKDTNPIFVKDARHLCPPYPTLLAAGAPMHMFPIEGLSRHNCWPHWLGASNDPQPALLIQANLIEGGVLLNFALQHQTGDGAGFALVMRHFAALMRGEELDDGMVEGAMAEWEGVLPLLREGEDGEDARITFPREVTDCPRKKEFEKNSPAPATWAIFHLPSASLRRLKRLTSPPDSNTWISTDDALLTLLWSRLSAVRLSHLPPEMTSQCSRAVDMRARCEPPLPAGYMGHSVLACPVEMALGDVAIQPLYATAIALRGQLQRMDARYLRFVASEFTAAARKDEVVITPPPLEKAAFLSMSSWAAFKVQELEFGVLCKPGFCRRPGKLALPGTAYVMPRFEDGAVDLQVCLEEREVSGLRNDEIWRDFAQWVG